jgi:cobalt/nickel transport system permease protein
MAHIHLEDGAFTPAWTIFWNLVAAGMIAAVLISLRKHPISPRRLAIAAMCTSVGFAIFQIEIPLFGGVHLNLTPLIGILAGPGLGSVSILMINVFSAAIGHGGWGMIGANTIVNMVEVVLGYYGFRFLRTRLRRDRFVSALSATVFALTVSALMIVLIVTISGVQDSRSTGIETFQKLIVIAAVNIGVGAFEGLLTGYVVAFIGRIRPDLLQEAEAEKKPVESAAASGA